MLGALGKVRGWIPWNILFGRYLTWLLLTAGPSSQEAEVAQSLPSKILVISKDFRALLLQQQLVPRLYCCIGLSHTRCSTWYLLCWTPQGSHQHFPPACPGPSEKKCVFITSVVFTSGTNMSRAFAGLPTPPTLCRDAKMEQDPCSHPMGRARRHFV